MSLVPIGDRLWDANKKVNIKEASLGADIGMSQLRLVLYINKLWRCDLDIAAMRCPLKSLYYKVPNYF